MKQLQRLRQNCVQYENRDEIKRVERQIHNVLANKEIFQKQRSRVDQLKEWDKYTNYFHYKALTRKKKNRISRIKNGTSYQTEKAGKVEHEFCDYFVKLFTTFEPSRHK